MNEFLIRQATVQDAAVIARQRRWMFADGNDYSEADLTKMEGLYEGWVARKLAAGDYWGWLAETETGEVIAGVGLWLREWPPILYNYTGKQGFVENVFTLPDYRRRGIARQLMKAMLTWVNTSQIVYEIELHPTQLARPLYESLGFEGHTGLMSQWFGPKH